MTSVQLPNLEQVTCRCGWGIPVAQMPGGWLSYCVLILTVKTTLRQGYEAWAEFADGANEETLTTALAITQDRLDAEAEIDEIVDMKRAAVRRARAIP